MFLAKNSKKAVWIILGLLACVNIIVWIVVFDLSRPRLLEVIFFDVGQGDSIFIETPNGIQVLIDGGPTSGILEKLAKEMPFYDRTLDLVILTHPDHDHLFGLLEVLKSYKIENILWTGVVRETGEWQEWARLLKEEGAEVKIAEAGQRVILQEEPLIFFDILNPSENLEGKTVKNTNDTSIVARLVFLSDSFLFTGDITKTAEKKLSERAVRLRSDVLKVPHHGSKTSSTREFLEAISPQLAVIQVGENNYGHPHPEVLARLEEFGIQVLRTDEHGDIKVVSDGDNF